MLKLKPVLESGRCSQLALAGHLGWSRPVLNALLNHGRWPVHVDREAAKAAIRDFLAARGLAVEGVFLRVSESCQGGNPDTTRTVTTPPKGGSNQEWVMLLRNEVVNEQAMGAWGLRADPFRAPEAESEVFLSRPLRAVREAMWQTALGVTPMLAVIGESGAGKSTLREALEERLRRERQPVLVISPFVQEMEDDDNHGRRMKSMHLAQAALALLKPRTPVKRSPQERLGQVRDALVESRRVGMRHLLVIEEAHSLALPTLRHLKRWLELKDGMNRLISVLLLGQTELADKLSETRAEVREVVQRCQVRHLPPLDADLEGYLASRFALAGVDLAAVLEPGAVAALAECLTFRRYSGAKAEKLDVVSLIHPLAVGNLLAAAMNKAAAVGAPKVTAKMVQAVREMV